MTRLIPRRVLPNVDLVTVEPVVGISGAGRAYGEPVTVHRAQIVDGIHLTGTQYEREAGVVGAVYCDRSAFEKIPPPDSRVTLWAGGRDEHQAFIRRVERYQHPRIADLLVMVLV